MNKITLLLIISLCASSTFSQSGTYKLKVKTMLGYEINPLRSPSSFIDRNGVFMNKSALYNNLPFVGGGIFYSSSSKTKKHRFDFYSNHRNSINSSKDSIRSAIHEGGIKYHLKTKKGNLLVSKLMYRDYVKTGGQDQDNLIGAPLSYKRIILENGYSIKLNRYWGLSITPRTIGKFYKRRGFNQFKYLHNDISTVLAYRYSLKNKIGYRLSTNLGQRNYSIQKQSNTAENDPDFLDSNEVFIVNGNDDNSNRMWRYYSVNLGTKIPLGKKFKAIVAAGFVLRNDILDDRLGYRQSIIGLDIQYSHKKLKLSGGINHLGRTYTTLSASGTASLLRYDYIKLRGNASYSFSNRLQAFAQFGCTRRVSNSDLETNRTLRSYFIGECSMGMRFSIKGCYGDRERIR